MDDVIPFLALLPLMFLWLFFTEDRDVLFADGVPGGVGEGVVLLLEEEDGSLP